MQLFWEICLLNRLIHTLQNRIIVTLNFKFSFTAKIVKQKDHFVECFDIIEVEDNFQGKADIDW